MDQETVYWILKFTAVFISVVVLYRFKRNIAKVVSDIMVGGDTEEYIGKDVSEVKKRVKGRMDEVLK